MGISKAVYKGSAAVSDEEHTNIYISLEFTKEIRWKEIEILLTATNLFH